MKDLNSKISNVVSEAKMKATIFEGRKNIFHIERFISILQYSLPASSCNTLTTELLHYLPLVSPLTSVLVNQN